MIASIKFALSNFDMYGQCFDLDNLVWSDDASLNVSQYILEMVVDTEAVN